MMKQPSDHSPKGLLKYVKGDATLPNGSNTRYLIQIVNDSGKYDLAFNKRLSTRWPKIETEYRNWWRSRYGKLNLGDIQEVQVLSDLVIVNMVAQHSDDTKSVIDYKALQMCLSKIGSEISNGNITLHIDYSMIKESFVDIEPIIDQEILKRGINVVMYDQEYIK